MVALICLPLTMTEKECLFTYELAINISFLWEYPPLFCLLGYRLSSQHKRLKNIMVSNKFISFPHNRYVVPAGLVVLITIVIQRPRFYIVLFYHPLVLSLPGLTEMDYLQSIFQPLGRKKEPGKYHRRKVIYY